MAFNDILTETETIKTNSDKASSKLFSAAVLVAALGYFVDIYDLLLFSIVRVPSLQSLGLKGQDVTDNGIFLLNIQMIGLLTGGIFWGILADKKGRLYVLFGSIFLYSIANIANGFVDTVQSYAIWRFIAGFGLAGELGAGITLVAELMPKEKRGYAATIIASVGVSGAVAGFFIAQLFDWRTCFFIGGGLGLSLLFLRIGVVESGMFGKLEKTDVKRGDFFSIFKKGRFLKYIRCILIGVPLWFVVGILITLSPEFGKILNVSGPVNAGAAVAWCYGGLVLGDITSGLLSQYLKSRIKVVYAFLFLSAASLCVFFLLHDISLMAFYATCLLLGYSVGYWVIFMTIATEQFGTNIRATVTTTVPNFVRGSVVPLSLLLKYLMGLFNGSLIYAGVVVAIISLGLAFWALSYMQETFSKDLEYVEDD
ncbi:MFS transporter [Mucilaginibacter sp.]|jgi:MFS family permease|uniref:MFS transporter n=1 Tax=Mucilaginibacter sp. TaxID=1882438 RepID=UPI00356217EB